MKKSNDFYQAMNHLKFVVDFEPSDDDILCAYKNIIKNIKTVLGAISNLDKVADTLYAQLDEVAFQLDAYLTDTSLGIENSSIDWSTVFKNVEKDVSKTLKQSKRILGR